MLKSRGQDAVGASKLGKPGVAVLPTRPLCLDASADNLRKPDEQHQVDDGLRRANAWDSIIGATLGPPDTRGHPQTRTLANARNPHSRAKLATSRQQRQAPAADS
jgi:hypothetical protein